MALKDAAAPARIGNVTAVIATGQQTVKRRTRNEKRTEEANGERVLAEHQSTWRKCTGKVCIRKQTFQGRGRRRRSRSGTKRGDTWAIVRSAPLHACAITHRSLDYVPRSCGAIILSIFREIATSIRLVSESCCYRIENDSVDCLFLVGSCYSNERCSVQMKCSRLHSLRKE